MKISRKRITLIVVALFCLIGLIYMAVYLKSIADYKKAVEKTTFTNIDISDIPDGVYIGEYDVNVIYAKVEVTLANGEITNINILEHRNERGKSAETVTDKIIEEHKRIRFVPFSLRGTRRNKNASLSDPQRGGVPYYWILRIQQETNNMKKVIIDTMA